MALTNKQKLDILELGFQNGLSIKDIGISEEKVVRSLKDSIVSIFLEHPKKVITMSYKDLPYKLMIYLSDNQLPDKFIKFKIVPGNHSISNKIRSSINEKEKYSWEKILELTKLWMLLVKEEVLATQKISYLKKVNSLFNIDDLPENKIKFNKKEAEIISNQILEFKNKLSTEYPIDKNNLTIINKKLDELVIRISELNKLEFLTAFWSILTNTSSLILIDNNSRFWQLVNSFEFPMSNTERK